MPGMKSTIRLSNFGEKFTARTGILELMDDLGNAMSGDRKKYMLGGGNPGHIPEVNALWRRRMQEILANGDEFERMVANYDTPRGKETFLRAVADTLNAEYGWRIGPENVAVTNGSQTAFFIILNLFAGLRSDGTCGRVMFPLCPEYIGYADQATCSDAFVSRKPAIEMLDDHTFKYHVDFDGLEIGEDIGAVCVSRPTNPTGNVLTDGELKRLTELTAEAGVPLFVDNAYGAPFPSIIFEQVTLEWAPHMVLGFSLSKIGLPSTRTGIIVASEEIIRAVSSCNAILSLSNGSIGQVLAEPLIADGELVRIAHEVVRPYYERKSATARAHIAECFDNSVEYGIHKNEGAFFLWLWFKNLSIGTDELYRRLKKRDVIVVPGRYFFYGLNESWEHSNQCIRMSFAQDDEDVRRGIEIIAEEAAKAV